MEFFYDLKMLNTGGIQKMATIGLMPFFFMLLVSLLTSLFISHLYLRFYGVKGTGSTVHRAFPLLGVAITAIFVSLQFSIPLSLGLLGALSIVRFRTPIKDPEEIGFILLVIASSLCCATFNLPFLSILLLAAIIGLIVLKVDKKFFRKNSNEGICILKVSKQDLDSNQIVILDTINKYLSSASTDSLTEDNECCTLTYNFSKLSDEDSFNLRKALKEISQNIELNIFYNNIRN